MVRKKRLTKEEENELYEYIVTNNKDYENVINSIKVTVKCKTENQKKLVKSIQSNQITICSGLAGSGKTYLSLAESLKLLKRYEKFKKIILVKSVTTLKNEEIGFLKGGIREKMEPFIYSFIHNFNKIIGEPITQKLRELNIIEILPIAYMRGINVDNAIVIIDETQNISMDNIRTIMTRLGNNSKMVFLGDINQIDLRNKKESSLESIMDRFNDLDEVGVIRLGSEDVVRNPLIKKIEDIFKEINK